MTLASELFVQTMEQLRWLGMEVEVELYESKYKPAGIMRGIVLRAGELIPRVLVGEKEEIKLTEIATISAV